MGLYFATAAAAAAASAVVVVTVAVVEVGHSVCVAFDGEVQKMAAEKIVEEVVQMEALQGAI
jgi:hypothetical protein